MQFRFLAALVLPCLAAAAGDIECHVDKSGDVVIVRSPKEQGNFAFLAPGTFREVEAPEGFLVRLEAVEDGKRASIALRIIEQGADDARQRLTDIAPSYAGRELDEPSKPEVEGRGLRATARLRGKAGGVATARTLLLVRDGTFLYVLYLDRTPVDAFPDLDKVAEGFTITEAKSKAEAVPEFTPEDLKARTIEKDFYRLNVLKPEGFGEMQVDPNSDAGIVLHLRRQDEAHNLCEIRIRVFLTKTLKESVEARAANRLSTFTSKHPTAKVPRRASRTRWPGAKAAYKAKLVGKTQRGLVVTEEWRWIEHENERTYEVEMTLYGAAAREWRKEISAFWRKLKIENR
jgi:hypothetical protein